MCFDFKRDEQREGEEEEDRAQFMFYDPRVDIGSSRDFLRLFSPPQHSNYTFPFVFSFFFFNRPSLYIKLAFFSAHIAATVADRKVHILSDALSARE